MVTQPPPAKRRRTSAGDRERRHGLGASPTLDTLPPAVKLRIMCALPYLDCAVSLHMTNHAWYDLLHANKDEIVDAFADRLVAPFLDFYTFLTTVHIPRSALKLPPPGGWRNITPQNCRSFNKSGFALSVLSRMPYISRAETRQLARKPYIVRHATPWGHNDKFHNVDEGCVVLDYSSCRAKHFKKQYPRRNEWRFGWDSDEKPSRHEVVVAEGYDNEQSGAYWLLDTNTGTIVEEYPVEPECRLDAWDFFAEKKKKWLGMQVLFVPGWDPLEWRGAIDESRPGMRFDRDPLDMHNAYDAEKMEARGEPSNPDVFFGAEDDDFDWVYHLYRKFGFPGAGWRQEEGLRAIREFAARRLAECPWTP